MHQDLPYDVFTIPRLHLSERRRLAEGLRVRNEMERAAVKAGESGGSGDAQRRETLKQRSKKRAGDRFAESPERHAWRGV